MSHELKHNKGPHEAESLEPDSGRAPRPHKSKESKAKKGAMPPNLSYRHFDHENRVTLSLAPWVDPWVGLRSYGIQAIRPTTVMAQ